MIAARGDEISTELAPVSAEAVAIAMHHSRAKGAARMVLWGIANHDGDGGSWPAIATLARYANITPRNAAKAIVALERLGEIRRLVREGGNHRTAEHLRPNLYEFLLKCPPGCDGTKKHRVKREDVAMPLDVELRDGEYHLLDEEELSTPPSPATGGALSTPPSLPTGDPPSLATGEVDPLNPPTISSSDQPQTAHGPVTDPQLLASMSDEERLQHDLEHDRSRLFRRRCTDGSQLHDFIDAQSNWCERCGIHRYKDQRKNWNTSEIRDV